MRRLWLRELSEEEQAAIERLAHSRTAPVRQVERARISGRRAALALRLAQQGLLAAPRLAVQPRRGACLGHGGWRLGFPLITAGGRRRRVARNQVQGGP